MIFYVLQLWNWILKKISISIHSTNIMGSKVILFPLKRSVFSYIKGNRSNSCDVQNSWTKKIGHSQGDFFSLPVLETQQQAEIFPE